MTSGPGPGGAGRRHAGAGRSARANRVWWDGEAEHYYREHGAFLGDRDFVWGPEGLREADAALLGDPAGQDVLEIGAGAGQCSRWLAGRGATVVATDISAGMIRAGRRIDSAGDGTAPTTSADPAAYEVVPVVPFVQCDARGLPFPDGRFDTVFTAYGVVPFVADSQVVMSEAARVLRPGGRFVFSTTHPLRWALPDDPGPAGLTVTMSYFDRTPYVEHEDDGELAYVEHHRTLGDRVREITAAGLVLVDVVEPEWPGGQEQEWGGWSPLRGRLVPGTAIFVCEKPGQARRRLPTTSRQHTE